jgi:hypothetical protein
MYLKKGVSSICFALTRWRIASMFASAREVSFFAALGFELDMISFSFGWIVVHRVRRVTHRSDSHALPIATTFCASVTGW